VQVQLRQQAADFLRAPLERRQQPALEALVQPAHPRPAQRDRPVAQAEPSRFPEPVAMARRRVDHRLPLIPSPAEELVHFFLQHLLQQPLHAVARERLQRRPFSA